MFRAAAEQREVAHVEHEAVLAFQRGAQIVEYRDGYVAQRAAHFAREVLMNLAEVIHGGTVSEVRVRHDADRREGLECSVHGGQMHVGIFGADDLGDGFRAEVLVGVEEHTDHEAARGGDAPAVGADLIEHRVDVTRSHPASVRTRRKCRSHPVSLLQNRGMEQPSLETLIAGLGDIRQSPADHGVLELIVRRPSEGMRETLETGELNHSDGLAGDTWNLRPSRRSPDGGPHIEMQLNIMNSRAIARIAQTPDRWALAGDQLFVDLDLSEANLPAGTHLAIGSAVIEVTAEPHTGCAQFSERFGADARKFVNSDGGRELRVRGINAKVVRPGTVTRGDQITKV